MFNANYFENIDNEDKAYWLGFIYADGYVRTGINNRWGQLKIKLSTKDRDHLEVFKKCIDSHYEIKDNIEKFKKDGREYISHSSTLNVYNLKMVKDLMSIGCVNNKTFKIRMPIIREELYRHFIRGYFDGDGCIYVVKNRPNSFKVTICSNIEFIQDIFNYLGYGIIRLIKKISILEISKIENIKTFRDYMYNDSNIYLKRKKDKFNLIDDNYIRDYSLTKNKKTYIIEDPLKNEFIVTDLHKFCDDNNLKYSTMSNLSRGIGRTNKGWTCKLKIKK